MAVATAMSKSLISQPAAWLAVTSGSILMNRAFVTSSGSGAMSQIIAASLSAAGSSVWPNRLASATKATDVAIELAGALDASLHIVSVWQLPTYDYGYVPLQYAPEKQHAREDPIGDRTQHRTGN